MAEAHRHDADITAHIGMLRSDNLDEVIAAAEFLFERAHSSHMRSWSNKDQMRLDGAIPLLFKTLQLPSDPARYNACSALSELAFRNEANCSAIVHSNDGLASLMALMQGPVVDMQEDATLVINNCAAFCEDVCPVIVACPDMLRVLTQIILHGECGAQRVAVGVINCLSRSAQARDALLASRVVETALLPVLRAKREDIHAGGETDKEHHDAHVARATMAIANLSGLSNEMFEDDDSRLPVLRTTVSILGAALKGESWAGIHFAPYSIMYPMRNVVAASSDRDKSLLCECGLVGHLLFLLSGSSVAYKNEESMAFALDVSESLCSSREVQTSMRSGGMVQALRALVKRPKFHAGAMRVLDALLAGHIAVWMGQHRNLGAGSPLHLLDEFVIGMILDHAFGANVLSTSPR
mmetsp:Transcript_102477/g.165142  ORF Transcript_102477/g.165142 Transcript_102477/m.165142 type:complete len:410 (-) Transcript_102477:63-1292(-)